MTGQTPDLVPPPRIFEPAQVDRPAWAPLAASIAAHALTVLLVVQWQLSPHVRPEKDEPPPLEVDLITEVPEATPLAEDVHALTAAGRTSPTAPAVEPPLDPVDPSIASAILAAPQLALPPPASEQSVGPQAIPPASSDVADAPVAEAQIELAALNPVSTALAPVAVEEAAPTATAAATVPTPDALTAARADGVLEASDAPEAFKPAANANLVEAAAAPGEAAESVVEISETPAAASPPAASEASPATQPLAMAQDHPSPTSEASLVTPLAAAEDHPSQASVPTSSDPPAEAQRPPSALLAAEEEAAAATIVASANVAAGAHATEPIQATPGTNLLEGAEASMDVAAGVTQPSETTAPVEEPEMSAAAQNSVAVLPTEDLPATAAARESDVSAARVQGPPSVLAAAPGDPLSAATVTAAPQAETASGPPQAATLSHALPATAVSDAPLAPTASLPAVVAGADEPASLQRPGPPPPAASSVTTQGRVVQPVPVSVSRTDMAGMPAPLVAPVESSQPESGVAAAIPDSGSAVTQVLRPSSVPLATMEPSPAAPSTSTRPVAAAEALGSTSVSAPAAVVRPVESVIAPAGPTAPAAPNARPIGDLAVVAPPREAMLAFDPDQAIKDTLSRYGCSRISSRYALSKSEVLLSGHVQSDVDRLDLLAKISATAGVKEVDASDLYVVGEPYCRVLSLLSRADMARSKEQRENLAAIGEPAQSGVLNLLAGMPIEIDLRAPDFPSYIYVDYYTSDGQVFHLLPAVGFGQQPFQADQRFGIGGAGDAGLPLTVAPPFGLDMVVALGSSERLFEEKPPASEASPGYIAAIDAAVDRVKLTHPDLRLEYAYHLIFTSARPSQ